MRKQDHNEKFYHVTGMIPFAANQDEHIDLQTGEMNTATLLDFEMDFNIDVGNPGILHDLMEMALGAIKRVKFTLNNHDTWINCTGLEAYVRAVDDNRRAPTGLAMPTVNGSTVKFTLPIDHILMDSNDPYKTGLLLRGRKVDSCRVTISWGDENDIYSTGASDHKLTDVRCKVIQVGVRKWRNRMRTVKTKDANGNIVNKVNPRTGKVVRRGKNPALREFRSQRFLIENNETQRVLAAIEKTSFSSRLKAVYFVTTIDGAASDSTLTGNLTVRQGSVTHTVTPWNVLREDVKRQRDGHTIDGVLAYPMSHLFQATTMPQLGTFKQDLEFISDIETAVGDVYLDVIVETIRQEKF